MIFLTPPQLPGPDSGAPAGDVEHHHALDAREGDDLHKKEMKKGYTVCLKNGYFSP